MPSSLSSGIIGHATVLHLLECWLQQPTSGYVFYGPAHVGKRTIAERFVMNLLGKEESNLNRAHPDLIVLEAEEGKAIVSVEMVRKARSRLLERPMVAERMVCFIPRIDRLNEEGMNALLKVLEEPPASAVFVAISEDISRLPATVQSRMVKVPFHLVPQKDLVEGLRARSLADDEAMRRADRSRGRPGLALLNEEDERSILRKKQAEQFVKASSVGERLMIIETITKECESSDSSVDAWSALLDAWSEVLTQSFLDNPDCVLVVGQGIVTARRMIGGALSPRFALEAAALRLATTNPRSGLFPTPISSSIPVIFQF